MICKKTWEKILQIWLNGLLFGQCSTPVTVPQELAGMEALKSEIVLEDPKIVVASVKNGATRSKTQVFTAKQDVHLKTLASFNLFSEAKSDNWDLVAETQYGYTKRSATVWPTVAQTFCVSHFVCINRSKYELAGHVYDLNRYCTVILSLRWFIETM